MNECLPEAAGGDVVKILNVPSDFGNIQNMLDGFTGFNNFRQNITDADGYVSMNETVKVWEEFQVGNLIQVPSQQSMIDGINDSLKCASPSFSVQLGPKECQDTCRPVSQNPNLTLPECASGAQANYNNLRQSYDQNVQTLNTMLDNAKNNIGQQIKTMQGSMSDSMLQFDKVQSALNGTLKSVETFSGGLNKILDCRIARKELKDIEAGICFEVRKRFYMLFIFTTLTTIMMIILNCCICCSVRKDGKSNKVDVFESNLQKKENAKLNKA